MAKFQYTAKDGPSKVVDGIIEAEDIDKAVAKIIQLGLAPLDVGYAKEKKEASQEKERRISFQFSQRIKLSDVASFTRQMSDLIDASVPMLRALQVIQRQVQNAKMKNVVKDLYEAVRDGSSLSDALGRHKQVFNSLYVSMVRTGEVGGNLGGILLRLADYLEKEQETISKVRSSLAYPSLILAVGIITIFVLLTFVIPKLSVMFEDLDQQLPMPTIMLTVVSAFFARFWWLMVIFVGILGVYFRRWTKTKHGREKFDQIQLRIPLLGEFIKTVEIARFSRTLGTLLETNVSMTTALSSVVATLENVVLKEEVRKVSDEVANGSSLRVALNKCKYFPEAATNMISIGEETGELYRGLYKVANTFDRSADQTIKTLISLLGPIVLVGVFMIVGFVIIAMMLPIFKMNLLIQ